MISSIILAIALMQGSAATDALPVEQWKSGNFTYTLDVRGSASEDYEYRGIFIETTDPTMPSLRLSCSQREGLVAWINTIAANDQPPNQFPDRPTKLNFRYKKYNFEIEGREKQFITMRFHKKQKAYETRKRKPTAQIFNAVVQGKSFKIHETRIDPPPIDENFKWFANECHITNPDKSN